MSIPKKLITGVDFDFEKGDSIGDGKEISYGPHIAYTLKSQNGAASGLNNPFLLKSDNLEISEEDKEMIKEIKKGSEEVLKLAANKQKNLQTAIKERFPKTDSDECYSYGPWVDTFDPEYVYFEKEGKMYRLPYTAKANDMVELADVEPDEVVRQIKFVPMEMMDEDSMMTTEMMMRNMMQMMELMKVGGTDETVDMGQVSKSAKEDLETTSEVGINGGGQTSEITKGDTNVEDKRDIQELLKSDELKEILKSMVDAETKEAKAEAKEAQEIAKAAQTELQVKKEEEITKAKNDLAEVVKSWGIQEDDQEEIVKGIFGNEHAPALIKAFDDLSQEVVKTKERFGGQAFGEDVKTPAPSVAAEDKALVDEIIKRNKAKKNK